MGWQASFQTDSFENSETFAVSRALKGRGFRDRVRTRALRSLCLPLLKTPSAQLPVGQESGQVERDGGQGELDAYFLQAA